MNPDQRKTAQVMLEFDIDPPAPLIMATCTLCPLLGAMGIVQFMTAETVGRLLLLFLPTAGVTLAAGQLAVFVPQRELGLVVIERAFPPAGGLVTFLTLVTEPATVQVFRPVAGSTTQRQILVVQLPRVTSAALNLQMLVLEREFGPTVIEQNSFPSRGLFIGLLLLPFRGMAGFAFLAVIPLMAVVEPMAGVTIPRNIFPALIRVTEGTVDFPVRSQQRKLGLFVVKAGF